MSGGFQPSSAAPCSAFAAKLPAQGWECRVPGPHGWNHPKDWKPRDQRWLSLPGMGLVQKNQVPRLSSSTSQVPAGGRGHRADTSGGGAELGSGPSRASGGSVPSAPHLALLTLSPLAQVQTSLSGTCLLLCPLESGGREARQSRVQVPEGSRAGKETAGHVGHGTESCQAKELGRHLVVGNVPEI